jgi:tRNA pseudouridine38-40 synthase
MKFSLTLSYDGTRYFGWQKTRSGPSIQEALEQAIAQIAREQVVPEAASRTDRGVHARGQVVAFSLEREWELQRLQKALNGTLPHDIRVVKIETAPSTFHPTLHARQKEYHYRLCLGDVQEPHCRRYSWHFRYPLNLTDMEEAAQGLIGMRDFRTFANGPEENSLCTLSTIAFVPLERQRLQIVLTGDRFLYKMARNLAGTLLYIGCGKLPPGSISALLQSKDRKQAGMTAPAHGLFLHRVDY